MARQTTKLELEVWDLGADVFNRNQLAENWDKIDEALLVAKQVELVATVPVTDNFAGRVCMLTADDSGFKEYSLLRYDGASWAVVGGVEVHASLPGTGNFAGRAVLCTSVSGVFPAYTLFIYNGTAFRPVDTVTVYNNEVAIGTRQNINFKEGTNTQLTVTDNTALNAVDIRYDATVPASAITIEKNGTPIDSKAQIEFITGTNSTVVATDIPDDDEVEVTWAAISTDPASSPSVAYTYWNPVAIAQHKTGTVLSRAPGAKPARVHPDRLNVSFTVPASGRVLLRLQGTCALTGGTISNARTYGWCVTESDVLVPDSVTLMIGPKNTTRSATTRMSAEIVIAGLTPGANKTWYWAHGINVGGTSNVGGFEGHLWVGGRGDIEGDLAGPLIMEVWAA